MTFTFLAAIQVCNDMVAEFPGAVVYGGFWRDVLLNRDIRDIDLALPANRLPLEDMGFERQIVEDLDYDHDHIHATWRRKNINICEVAAHVSPKGQNQYVDIGLCAVAWDEFDGLIVDNAFLTDALNRTLTVRRTGWGEEGVRKHLARLQKKYPEYEVVWP